MPERPPEPTSKAALDRQQPSATALARRMCSRWWWATTFLWAACAVPLAALGYALFGSWPPVVLGAVLLQATLEWWRRQPSRELRDLMATPLEPINGTVIAVSASASLWIHLAPDVLVVQLPAGELGILRWRASWLDRSRIAAGQPCTVWRASDGHRFVLDAPPRGAGIGRMLGARAPSPLDSHTRAPSKRAREAQVLMQKARHSGASEKTEPSLPPRQRRLIESMLRILGESFIVALLPSAPLSLLPLDGTTSLGPSHYFIVLMIVPCLGLAVWWLQRLVRHLRWFTSSGSGGRALDGTTVDILTHEGGTSLHVLVFDHDVPRFLWFDAKRSDSDSWSIGLRIRVWLFPSGVAYSPELDRPGWA